MPPRTATATAEDAAVGEKFAVRGGGQRVSDYCPVCGNEDRPGKWTCAPCNELVHLHRQYLRSAQQWRALYEAQEVGEIITGAGGIEVCLWDVERFYSYRVKLPPRQQQSITLCLWDNLAESKAAVVMGLSEKSPVGIYASVGVAKLLGMAYRLELPGYRLDGFRR